MDLEFNGEDEVDVDFVMVVGFLFSASTLLRSSPKSRALPKPSFSSRMLLDEKSIAEPCEYGREVKDASLMNVPLDDEFGVKDDVPDRSPKSYHELKSSVKGPNGPDAARVLEPSTVVSSIE